MRSSCCLRTDHLQPTPTFFHGCFWGSASNDVWIVGLGGTALHWNGLTLTAEPTGVTARLHGVWGSGPDDVHAVGTNGTLVHWDGSAWSEIDLGLGLRFWAVWGSGPDDVYIGGEGGILMRWDGSSWTRMSLGTSDAVRAIWGVAPDDIWVGGDNAMTLHLPHVLPALKGGACDRAIPIYCNTSVTGANYGKPSVFGSYPACVGARPDTGGDVFYRLHNAVTCQVTVNLTPASGGLDLMVVRADGNGGCDVGQCLGASATGGAEQVVISGALTDETYYIIVDGFAGAQSGYTLDVQCTRQ